MTPQTEAGSQGLAVVDIPSGTVIPDFIIQALDMWENPTRPCPEMPFDLIIRSTALEFTEATVHFEPIANITGICQILVMPTSRPAWHYKLDY